MGNFGLTKYAGLLWAAYGIWGCSAEATVCGGALVVDNDDLDADGDTSECIADSCSAGAPDCADYDVDDADSDGETCECLDGGEGEGEGGGFGDVDVAWTINGMAAGGGSYDTCGDVGADIIVLELQEGGKSISKKPFAPDCADFAGTIVDVPAGAYDLAAQLQTCDDAECTTGEALTGMVLYPVDVTAEGVSTVELNFASADFLATDPLIGTYAFSVLWDGVECDEAVPAVNQQIALLQMDGNLVPGAEVCLESGAQLCLGDSQCVLANGSDVHCCYDSDVTQTIADLEWGFYVLTISGDDFLANICFETEFTVFVGAGENPVETLDVGPITNPNCSF